MLLSYINKLHKNIKYNETFWFLRNPVYSILYTYYTYNNM